MNKSSQLNKTSRLRKSFHWIVCLIAIAVVSLYWALWASDRYVSHANVVLESPQLASPTLSVSSLLSGGGHQQSRGYAVAARLHALRRHAEAAYR